MASKKNLQPSLVSLAKQKKMPRWQFMDLTTLRWIVRHALWSGRVTSASTPTVDIATVIQYIPKTTWFLHSDSLDTIHGLRHLMRVVIFSDLVARHLGLSAKERQAALVAGCIHDLRRHDDRGDHGHAARAGAWFMRQVKEIERTFGIHLTAAERRHIRWAISVHEQPLVLDGRKHMSAEKILVVLKMADALDRYRLPKLKWWLNEQYLPERVPSSLKIFAFELVVRSERIFLQGRDSVTSVLQAMLSMI